MAYTGAASNMFGQIADNGQSGMLGGYLQGMANNYSMREHDNAIRDDDQAFLENLRKYQMAQAEDPTKLAEFANRSEEAALKTKLNNEGIPEQVARAAVAAKMDEQQAGIQKNAMQKQKDAGETIYNINEAVGDKKFDPMNQADNDKWGSYVTEAAKVGVRLPPAPTPEALGMLKEKALAYYNSPLQASKREEGRLERQNRIDIANIGYEGKVDSVVQRALNARETQRKLDDPDRVRRTEIEAKVKATGTVTPDDLQTYAESAPVNEKAMWEKNADQAKTDMNNSLRAIDDKAFTTFKERMGYPPNADRRAVINAVEAEEYKKKREGYAMRQLGNPKVVSPQAKAAPAAPPPDVPQSQGSAPVAESAPVSTPMPLPKGMPPDGTKDAQGRTFKANGPKGPGYYR